MCVCAVDTIRHLQLQGDTLSKEGHYYKAIECFSMAIKHLEHLPNSPKVSDPAVNLNPRERSRLFLCRSEAYLHAGCTEEAYRDAARCVKMDLNWYQVRKQLYLKYLSQQDGHISLSQLTSFFIF